jgi:hypothetical protein
MEKQFDPILCFARKPGQEARQVFDDIQDRIRTLIGAGLSKMSPDDVAGLAEAGDIPAYIMEGLKDWQRSDVVLTAEEFEKFAFTLDLSMSDVLGTPEITDGDRKVLQKSLPHPEGGLDPVKVYVLFSVIDRIDEMVMERRGSKPAKASGKSSRRAI